MHIPMLFEDEVRHRKMPSNIIIYISPKQMLIIILTTEDSQKVNARHIMTSHATLIAKRRLLTFYHKKVVHDI